MKLIEKVGDLSWITVGGIEYDLKKYLPNWFLNLKFESFKIDTENGNIFIEGKNEKEDSYSIIIMLDIHL